MLVSKQILFVKCDAKGCKAKVNMHDGYLAQGAEPMRPFIPFGWRRCGGLTYCPDHKLSVVVDGAKPRQF